MVALPTLCLDTGVESGEPAAYNPIQSLVGAHVLSQLSAANVAALTGRQFFPTLISGPFAAGLHQAFTFSLIVCLVAAVASWSRGGRVAAVQPIIAAEAPEI